MRLTEKHIRHFNLLNGNPVSKKSLVKFHKALQADIASRRIDAHMPGGVECLDIEARLAKAIKKINGHVRVAQFKPVSLVCFENLGKIAKEEPLRTKQLRAMFARLNSGSNLPKDKKEAKKSEPVPTKSKKEIKRELRQTFKPRSRGKLPTKERKQLDDFLSDINKDTARRAYNWTSFNPEKRGDSFREEYAQNLVGFISELKPVAEKHGKIAEFNEDFARYRKKMKELANAYLHSHSNVASAMITGPAKFPTERNRKRSDWADNKLRDYLSYDRHMREKLRYKYLPDSAKPVKTGQANALELLEEKLSKAKERHEFMKAVNKIIRSKKNVKERLRDELKLDDLKIEKLLRPDFANRTGYAQFYLTNNNAEIKRLEQRVSEVKKLNEKRAEGNKQHNFEGGHVLENFDENRLQIIFDSIPTEESRTFLKKNGFKWSPKNKAWQRQLTNNTKWVFTRVVLPKIESGELKGIEKNKVVNTPKLKRESKRPLPPVERNKRSKATAGRSTLNGLAGADQLTNIQFYSHELGPFKKEFHRLNSDSNVMIWGQPGHGKTVKLLQLAQHFADNGKNVLYISNEEFGKSTLSEKINEFKIGHANLKFARTLDEAVLPHFDVIFFDSINSMGLTSADVKRLDADHPNKLFFLIVQTTKGGDFRGGKDWEHIVDIAGEVRNRKLILRKNRLDPEYKAKAEKLMINELVSEQKQKAEIKKLVKEQTVPAEPATTQ